MIYEHSKYKVIGTANRVSDDNLEGYLKVKSFLFSETDPK